MPISKIYNTSVKGIYCALPNNPISIVDAGKENFSEEDIQKVSEMTGVKTLYRAKQGQTASDLCCSAAEKLAAELCWEKDTIEGIIFVSQTPDHITPATSCMLQSRLGLTKNCITVDINLGCSGYVYGLWLGSLLISSKTCSRVLVLVGDTLTRNISPKDKSMSLIISDGGSATALEYCENAPEMTFELKADGTGSNYLMIPAGGYRMPRNETTVVRTIDEDGNVRSLEDFYMNGMEVFLFATSEVPDTINSVLGSHDWTRNEVDVFLLHQANKLIINYISRKARLPKDKVPINIDRYGNCNGTSIPLLICDALGDRIIGRDLNVLMAGYGVGLSWGVAALKMHDLSCGGIIYI
jgi:3-oxoacyl-[acyl-carrier-protein] synthase III